MRRLLDGWVGDGLGGLSEKVVGWVGGGGGLGGIHPQTRMSRKGCRREGAKAMQPPQATPLSIPPPSPPSPHHTPFG